MAQYDVAIVGGGPAGLAAAAYLVRAGRSAVIVGKTLGGKVTYPFSLRDLAEVDGVWGAELTYQLEEFVRSHDPMLVEDNVATTVRNDDGSFTLTLESDGSALTANAVLIATGARSKRTIVEGELDYWGRGVSLSSISHAQHFAGRDVAVIGDGPRALVAGLELASVARRVNLVTPRLGDLSGLPGAEQVLRHPAVSIFSNWEVQAIAGDDFVTAIQLVGINGEVRQLPVEGVFVQLELLPNNDMVRGLVDFDERGHIAINQRCETSLPGIFAAGDVTNIHAELVPIALGEGAKAAVSAWEYLVMTERA